MLKYTTYGLHSLKKGPKLARDQLNIKIVSHQSTKLMVTTVVKFSASTQWCAIEMQHLLHKPYVNEVTLNGPKLYSKCCQISELRLCMLRMLRSFFIGTVSLCRSTGFKITSCQSWRMILLSANRTRAALVWFD